MPPSDLAWLQTTANHRTSSTVSLCQWGLELSQLLSALPRPVVSIPQPHPQWPNSEPGLLVTALLVLALPLLVVHVAEVTR